MRYLIFLSLLLSAGCKNANQINDKAKTENAKVENTEPFYKDVTYVSVFVKFQDGGVMSLDSFEGVKISTNGAIQMPPITTLQYTCNHPPKQS